MFFNFKIGSVKTQLGTFNYCGNLSILNGLKVSVAGARAIDSASAEWLRNYISNCDKTIVSGLALGADSVAHQTALNCGLPTIAVLPCGINNIAPRSNIGLARKIVENGGLLISAYPNKAGVSRDKYIARNKIIARLGYKLVVPQCEYRSGTMHTVRFAQQLNKPIIVQNADYSGNQYIINNLNGLAK